MESSANGRHEGADQHRESADELYQNGRPGEKVGSRHVQGVQDAGEYLGTALELGDTVLHESATDDQAQRKGPPCLAEKDGRSCTKLEQRFHAGILRSRPAGVTGRQLFPGLWFAGGPR